MEARPAPQIVNLLTQMIRIRLFEEEIEKLYRSAKLPGLTHLYIGEEAVAVGVCSELREDDYITSTHRGHGHCLAKGASVDLMFAEVLGKEAGYCRGKGGSMHVADQERGNLGANAIVGGSIGIATGAGFSAMSRGSGQVAACFFGDGALGQGLLYESMNMASLWHLPVIYVCENNLYGQYTRSDEANAGDILARPKAFGVHAETVDGQDVLAVRDAAASAIARARIGEGPTFLHCLTYRHKGHYVGDVDRSYRSRVEEAEWLERDPINLLAKRARAEGLSNAELSRIEEEVRTEVAAGLAFGLDAPYPDAAEVDTAVYA
jgi:pyruvate dehydrogenase E1 component alpha subunit